MTGNSQTKKSCRYTFWTWIVAVFLALYLFWHQQKHQDFSHRCCHSEGSASSADALPSTFKFTAQPGDFVQSGDNTNVSWLNKSADLAHWLQTGGGDWKLTGDATNVTLTGTVSSEEIKQQKGKEVEAIFGNSVTIDNQLIVISESINSAVEAPATAKLYFESGKSSLPADYTAALEPTLAWLKSNPNGKAVISGYHDASGRKETNALLAKNRAKAVREVLKAAGVDEARIEMRKPEMVEGGVDKAEARRVEIAVE